MTDWRDAWTAGTAADLVDDAHSLGIKASPRMVTDYVEAGLLASPLFRKTTQRGSDRRVFPPEQRRLFHELNCAKLRSSLPRVPHRTMIPVILYLWCMDDTVVTDTQARRALRTYAQSAGISSGPRRRVRRARSSSSSPIYWPRPTSAEPRSSGSRREVAKAVLRGAAVEPYVEGSGRARGLTAVGGQPGGAESVALGVEHAQVVAADGVRPGEVEYAGGVGVREFPQRGSQVLHVHRAAHVVGEQDSVARAGGQGVHHALVRGPAVPDDQRRAGDGRLRAEEPYGGLGGGLRGAVRGDRVGKARLVVVDAAPENTASLEMWTKRTPSRAAAMAMRIEPSAVTSQSALPLDALMTTEVATSLITPATCAGSRTSRACQVTPEAASGRVVANVAAV